MGTRETTVLAEVSLREESSGPSLPLWAVAIRGRVALVRAATRVNAGAALGDVPVTGITLVEGAEIGALLPRPKTFGAFNQRGQLVRVTVPED